MKAYDVIPFGERQFLLRFWPVAGFLEKFDSGQYYATTCRIVLSDGHAALHDCIVRRERRRNFANVLVDGVYVHVKSGLVAEALSAAAYQMTHVGRAISESEAIAWRSDPQSQSPDIANKTKAC
jgi:hydrogenase maturation factor